MHARLRTRLTAALALGAVGAFGVLTPSIALGSSIRSVPDTAAPMPAPLPANCEIPCTLTVTLTGNGSGTWLSTNSSYVPDGAIHCELLNGAITGGSDCSAQYGGVPRVSPVTVYFIKTPATGSCLLDSPDCDQAPVTGTYIMTGDALQGAQSATFQRLAYRVTVTRTGAGMGTVTSVPEGIACGNSCFADYLYGTAITLYAGPDAQSYFVGWTGSACAGQGPACSLTVPAAATTVNAVFGQGSGPPTAAPTAKPTPKPTAKPTAKSTAQPTAAGTAEATIPPVASAAPETSAPSVDGQSPAVATASAPAATAAPTAPAEPASGSATGSVLPYVLIGLAVILMVVAIGTAAFELGRRRRPPA